MKTPWIQPARRARLKNRREPRGSLISCRLLVLSSKMTVCYSCHRAAELKAMKSMRNRQFHLGTAMGVIAALGLLLAWGVMRYSKNR